MFQIVMKDLSVSVDRGIKYYYDLLIIVYFVNNLLIVAIAVCFKIKYSMWQNRIEQA